MIEISFCLGIGILICIVCSVIAGNIVDGAKSEAKKIRNDAEHDVEEIVCNFKKEAKKQVDKDARWIINKAKEDALIIVKKAKEEAELLKSSSLEEDKEKEESFTEYFDQVAEESIAKEVLVTEVALSKDMEESAMKKAESIIDDAMCKAKKIENEAIEKEKRANTLLLEVKETADSIISNAKSEAKKILEEANEIKEDAEQMLEYSEIKNYRTMDEVLSLLRNINKINRIESKEELDVANKYRKTLSKEKSYYVELGLWGIWDIDNKYEYCDFHVACLIKIALFYCDCLVDQVICDVYKNGLEISKKRIAEIIVSIERMVPSVFSYEISGDYIKWKTKQATTLYEIEEYKARKKEEQKALRELEREEARAQREYEREIKKAREDEVKAKAAIERARMEAEKERENTEKYERLQAKIAGLEEALQEAVKRGERALSMAQQTKHGTVYVISNIGSFGEGVYKIGLTRRLEPFERVHELGDASVPFPFDVHAFIESDDAPALETALHQAFANKKVNMINGRKEFFRVSLDEIKEKVQELGYVAEWADIPQAVQFRDSEYFRGNTSVV